MKYFLGRVSSKEQNLARQLKVAREKFDIPDENVYCDKITGSSFDRPQYNALKAIVFFYAEFEKDSRQNR